MFKKLAKLSLVFCLSLFAVACSSNTSETTSANASDQAAADSKPITLSYAFYAPEASYPAVIAKKWGEMLEQRTNGKVTVEFYFGGTLLDAANMIDGVMSGAADIGLAGLTLEPGRFPLVEISDLPFGYPNTKVASQVVSDLINEYPSGALKDYKIVKVFTTEPIYIQSKDPIASLEDMKGQQLRIGGSLTPILSALGASPVAMSPAEQAQALQTGIISGYVSERAMLKDMGFAEMTKYYTDYPLGLFTFTAVMNKEKFDSLPTDVQQVIDELNKEMPVIAGEYFDNHVVEALEWSKQEHGLQAVSLSEEEKKKWEEILNTYKDTLINKVNDQGLPGNEYRDRLFELLAKYSN